MPNKNLNLFDITYVEKDRLLKLADLLEADAANDQGMRFDLTYIGRKWDDEVEYYRDFAQTDQPTINCGTVGCAVGLACMSGEFADEGLDFKIVAGEVTPVFGECQGWNDAETKFFGLNRLQSDYLFYPASYPTHQQKGAEGERAVAARIRKFLTK